MGRFLWIDWAKALLIIFMVIGHYSSPDILKEFIYTFHMPAFFHICTMFKKNRLIEELSIGTLVILGLHRMPGVLYGLSNGHPLSWVASTIVTIIVGIMFIRIIGKKYPILMGKLSSNFCIYSFRFKKLFFLC